MRHLGEIKEVWAWSTELQCFLCAIQHFPVLKGHPRFIAYEGVYSIDYKLLSEIFGTNVFPKMKNGLQPKRNLGI